MIIKDIIFSCLSNYALNEEQDREELEYINDFLFDAGGWLVILQLKNLDPNLLQATKFVNLIKDISEDDLDKLHSALVKLYTIVADRNYNLFIGDADLLFKVLNSRINVLGFLDEFSPLKYSITATEIFQVKNNKQHEMLYKLYSQKDPYRGSLIDEILINIYETTPMFK